MSWMNKHEHDRSTSPSSKCEKNYQHECIRKVELVKHGHTSQMFGFSFMGGEKYCTEILITRIRKGGVADCAGLMVCISFL